MKDYKTKTQMLDLRSLEDFSEEKEWSESVHWLGLDNWLSA
jgi:hypothetical protein